MPTMTRGSWWGGGRVIGLAMAAMLCTWERPAAAQDVFALPHACIGWWAVDPAAPGLAISPERLAAAIALLMTSDRPVGPETPALAAAVLAGSLECGVRNRIVLVDVAGEAEAGGPGWRCERLSVVVEAGVEGGVFEEAIRAAMAGHGSVEDGALDLPGGMSGRWLSVKGQADWRRVEIGTGRDRTVVAMGTGVLAAWLAPTEGIGPVASRQRAVRAREGTRPVFELLLDLDRLRAAVPERFSQQRVGRELEACGLANARAFSLAVAQGKDGADAPPIMAAWASRSDPVEQAIGVSVNGRGIVAAPEGWSWAVDWKGSMKETIGLGLGMARAWRTRFGMMEFDRGLERWSKSDAGGRALGVLGLGEVDMRLGAGVDGMLRGRVVIPAATAESVAAAVGSLPGALEKEAGRWEIPVLSAVDDPGAVLRRIEVVIATDGGAVEVEARVVGP